MDQDMHWRVGSVPYVNAAPLVWGLGSEGIEVVTAVPSQLPSLLATEEVQAILVSSIFPLVNPGLRMVADVGIASHRAVTSVKIFSRLPLHDVQTLSLDASSMTSNRLALEILRAHGSCPQTLAMHPDLPQMLAQADAAVLIGDNGMTSHMDGVREYDLGEEWRTLTGLPFLWAGWVGADRLDEDLALRLTRAGHRALDQLDQVVEWSSQNSGLPLQLVRPYLTETMSFLMTDPVKAGYREYARRIGAGHFPVWVGQEIQSRNP